MRERSTSRSYTTRKRTKSSKELIEFWEHRTPEDKITKSKSMVYSRLELEELVSPKEKNSAHEGTCAPLKIDAVNEVGKDHLTGGPDQASFVDLANDNSESQWAEESTCNGGVQIAHILLCPAKADQESDPSQDVDVAVADITICANGTHQQRQVPQSQLSVPAIPMGEAPSSLMELKQIAIKRLESLGYDPYKGIYIAHRKYLMLEKNRVIHRLEELGYNPYSGLYVAHRTRLMEEKVKVMNRLYQLGFDPRKGLYAAHRSNLMEEKHKAISRLTALGFDPFTGTKSK